MKNAYCLAVLAALILVPTQSELCFASDGDKAESPEENVVKKDGDKKFEIIPQPSMSSNSPAFQSPLTRLIRTKGHADSAKKKGDFEKAKKLYLRCIKDPKVNHRSLGYCYSSLADIYAEEGNSKEAKKYYKLALAQMKKHKVQRQVDALEDKLAQLKDSK